MISPIDNYIKSFSEAGSDIITFHQATNNTAHTIGLIKKYKDWDILKTQISISLIEKYINEIDLILIMSVEPGFGGQKFQVLDKVKSLKKIISEET